MSAPASPPPAAAPGAVLLILAAAAAWGAIGPFLRGLFERGFAPLEVALWRALVGGLLFALEAALRRDGDWGAARRHAPALAGFALLGVSGFYAALPLAIAAGGVSQATVLLYTAPAWVVLLARPLLGEPLGARKLLLCTLALGGVVLLALGGDGAGVRITPASLGWGLLAGLLYAAYYLAGKPLFARVPPPTALALVLPLGALGLLPWARPRLPVDAAGWGLILGLGLLCTWLPFRLYAAGLRRCEASRAALLATLEPVVALLLAAGLLGERLAPAGLAGGALVLASAVGAALPARAAPGPAA